MDAHILVADPEPALQLFGEGAFFQPYFPLQQMDDLAAESWLIGTTNQIVTQQKECKYDLMVNVSDSCGPIKDNADLTD